MAKLRLRIPESGLAGDSLDALQWALFANDGALARSGRALPADLPRADEVEFVVPASVVLLTKVQVPPVRGQKLRQLLPFAVEEQIVQDPETVHVAAAAREPDGQTPVAVIDKAWLNDVLVTLKTMAIKPARAFAETLMPALEHGSWTCVVAGANSFVRTGLASGFALDAGTSTEPPFALQQAIKAARETVDAAEAPNHIVLRAAPDSGVSIDSEAWAARLGVPVVRDRDWDFSDAMHATAPPIDLLQGVFSQDSKLSELLPRLKPVLALTAAIVVLQIGATTADWFLLSREKRALEAEMTKSFLSLYPGSVVQNPAAQMKNKLAELRSASGQGEPSDLLPLLETITPLIGAAEGTTVKSLNYGGGSLRIDLVLPDMAATEALKARLPNGPVRARVEAVNPKESGVEARLVLSGAAS